MKGAAATERVRHTGVTDFVSGNPRYVGQHVSNTTPQTQPVTRVKKRTGTTVIVITALDPIISFEQGFGSNSTLFASVYALDALGAASRATFGVVVSTYQGSVEDLGAVIEGVATEALAAGDTDTVMQVRGLNHDACFLG